MNCFPALSQWRIFASENEGVPGGRVELLSLREMEISAFTDQKAENIYLIKCDAKCVGVNEMNALHWPSMVS